VNGMSGNRLKRLGTPVAAMALLALLWAPGASAQSRPGQSGQAVRVDTVSAGRLGWDPARLERALGYADSLGTDALVIATEGRTVAAMGDLSARHPVASVRKALLNALVGQHVGDGPDRIPLDATLEQLGIDDAPVPLTPLQRQATVLHLLKSVSGINHPAAAEQGMQAEKDRRLGRGENRPGTVWAYNNWDYNAVTTVFERRTGQSVADAFAAGIAGPLGMQDFTPEAVTYIADRALSRHRAAMFAMSARDLVRFGELYLGRGEYRGTRVLPAGWVDRITTDYTETGMGGLRAGHGYLWWIPAADTGLPEGTYWALGLGFQAVFVIPAWRTVIVHQADMTAFWKRLFASIRQDGLAPAAALERLILSCRTPAVEDAGYCREDRFILRGEFARLMSLVVAARR